MENKSSFFASCRDLWSSNSIIKNSTLNSFNLTANEITLRHSEWFTISLQILSHQRHSFMLAKTRLKVCVELWHKTDHEADSTTDEELIKYGVEEDVW